MLEVKDCHKCFLLIKRKKIVNSWGNPNSAIVFIGEAPGYHEDKTGIPFVGDSGKLLRHYIKAIGLEEDCVLTNLLRCRPPGNRNPLKYEVKNCISYLKQDIKTLEPTIIVLVGNQPTDFIIPNLTKARGIPVKHSKLQRWYIQIYHPSYILRNPKEEVKFYNQFMTIRDLYLKKVSNILLANENRNLDFTNLKYLK